MTDLKPKKVFIVDDDPMLTEALSDYLTREVQHDIKSFSTGEACLKCLDENPDVIVLDYYLDTLDKDAANGMQILQHIKTHSPNMNIIMLSSQESYLVAMQTIKKGAEQYVIKDEKAFQKIAKIIQEIQE